MVYDTIIVGGGVSGLMTAYNLILQKRRVLVVERGHQFYERNHNNPFDVANGIGGSGLFSDGKVSLFPSATHLWRLEKDGLKKGYLMVSNFLNVFNVNLPPFSDEWTTTTPDECSFIEKKYNSLVLNQEQRMMIVFKLIQTIGPDNILADSDVVKITCKNNAFEVVAKKQSVDLFYRSHTVVLAGGKHQFETILPKISGLQFEQYGKYEVGIRVECPNPVFDFYEDLQKDVKLIEKVGDYEIRTFCCCKGGRVLESSSDGFVSHNGTSNDFKSSEKTNIGFIVTIPAEKINEKLKSDLHNKKSKSISLTQFLSKTDVILTIEVDEIIRNFIKDRFPQMASSSDSVVYFPEFERFGMYPKLGENLRVGNSGVWLTGDSTGLFRGLLPAFVSGSFVSYLINGFLTEYEQDLMRQFHIKVSANTDRKVIFTAQSKQWFFCRDAVCEFVFNNDCIPINPFRTFGYFLNDRVDRGLVRNGNNEMISRCDELWVFGPISDGVLFEIFSCIRQGKPVRFFNIATYASEIKEISVEDTVFEPEVHAYQIKKGDLKKLIEYGGEVVSDNQLKLFNEY